jgi:hypothetical protein
MTITVKLGTTNNLGVSEVHDYILQPQIDLIRWALVFNIEAQPLPGSNRYPTLAPAIAFTITHYTHYRYRQPLVTSTLHQHQHQHQHAISNAKRFND